MSNRGPVVTIDLGGWFDEDSNEGEGFEARALRMVARELSSRIDRAAVEAIQKQLVDGVKARIDAEIQQTVRTKLEEGLALTNGYGEPTGKTTTLRALIVERAEKWLTEKVDSRGEARGYGDNTFPRLQWFIAQQVDAAMKGAIKTSIDAAVAEVKGKLQEGAKALLAEGMAKLLGVPVA